MPAVSSIVLLTHRLCSAATPIIPSSLMSPLIAPLIDLLPKRYKFTDATITKAALSSMKKIIVGVEEKAKLLSQIHLKIE